MKPVVFFGTAEFSAPALEALLAQGWPVAAVVTKPDSRLGRGQDVQPPVVKAIAEAHGVSVLQPHTPLEALAALQKLNAPLGVVVAYGKLLPQPLIDAFPRGLINIHASLLPKYRGPAPIEAAILNSDSQTGVSLMQIELSMDTGGVYAQARLRLHGQETKPELYALLSQLGAELLLNNLDAVMNGIVRPTPQPDQDVSYTSLITKKDGLIDWTKPAQRLEREIRAYLGWPGSYTQIAKKPVTILEAYVIKSTGPAGEWFVENNKFGVYCKTDALIVESLKPAGKTAMAGMDFIRGLK